MAFPRGVTQGRKDESVYVFDIGSGSVGCGIVHCTAGAPTLLYTTRVPMTFQQNVSLERLREEMFSSLRRVMERAGAFAQSLAGERPRRAHVVLASPWYLAHTHTARIAREEEFAISHRFVAELTGNAEKALRRSLSERRGYDDEALTRIEQSIIQTSLNGYPTSDPFNKRARRIETALFVSLIPIELKKRFERELEEALHVDRVVFHSFVLASFSAVRDIYFHTDDFLLVDVSGEVTDVGLTRDNVLLESVSFSWGRNFVLREVASRLGTLPEEVHSLLRLSAGRVSERDAREATALNTVEEMWLTAFKNTCSELAKGERLPKRVFLTTLADTAPWFRRVIERDECGVYTFTGEPFDVVLLTHQTLAKHYALAPEVRPDAFLGLEALFVNRVVA